MNHLLWSWESSIFWIVIYYFPAYIICDISYVSELLIIAYMFWDISYVFEFVTSRMLCEAIAEVMTITHSGPLSLSIRIARLPSPHRRDWEVMTPFGADSGWDRHSPREILVIYSSLCVSGAFVHYNIIYMRACCIKRLIMIRNSQSYLGRMDEWVL